MKNNLKAGNSYDLYRRLVVGLQRCESMALATVIARSGSGPREPGASMLVTAAGETLGTVGGGVLEAQVIGLAQEAIREARSFCREFVLTAQQAEESGMICGGRMEVLIDYCGGDDATRRAIVEQMLQKAQGSGQVCWLVRSIRKTGAAVEAGQTDPLSAARGMQTGKAAAQASGTPVRTGIGLMAGDDFLPGSLDVSEAAVTLLKQERRRSEAVLLQGRQVRCFIQPVGRSDTVVIIGAGHVAQALAPLCRFAGFSAVIIDDRADFANPENFPDADEILVPPSFEQCFGNLEIGEGHYVVIVSRGHAHDQVVLTQSLRTTAGYIGMIGSSKKRDSIYRNLLTGGFTHEDLARCHCPIGLSIGAQTPEEIAVSIVAELIAVRSKK